MGVEAIDVNLRSRAADTMRAVEGSLDRRLIGTILDRENFQPRSICRPR